MQSLIFCANNCNDSATDYGGILMLEEIVIVDMKRSAFTRGGRGALVATRLDEVAVQIIHALLADNPKITLDMIEEVGLGQVGQAGELLNMGSAQIAQLAGIPYEASKFESNRQCGSSMEVIHRMTQAMMLGSYDVGLCIGVERMEKALMWPMTKTTRITKINSGLFKHHNAIQSEQAKNHFDFFKQAIPEPILQSSPLCTMLQTAQNVADMYQIDRADLDSFSLASHQKYGIASKNGFYDGEIVPLTTHAPIFDADQQCDYTQTGPEITLKIDDGYRSSSSLDKLQSLMPIPGIQSTLKRPIVITAGNSCPTNDGVSACLLMNAKKAKSLGLKPLARIVGMNVSGIKPQIMGVGPVIAVKKVLQQAQMRIKDIDSIEFNEAFASQVLATMRELEIPEAKLNPNGGSLAIGHPLGATGIRLVGTLAKSLHYHQRRYGIATQCIGAGMGIATLIENLR